jgi:3-ketosteroid 9alpha-monooxygenase subunit B
MALQFHQLTIADIVEETADCRSLLLDVPPPLRERFAYRAGQFLTFQLPWNEFTIRRCYSLSSAPEIDPIHRVTVKRVAGGRMSSWMVGEAKVGDVLTVAPPDGRFVLDAEAGERPLTLLGGGSGITPLLSLMKTALHRTRREIKLVYANRDADAIIFKSELEALASEFAGRVQLHHHLDGERGFLTREEIRQLINGREQGDYYVCGPAPLMNLIAEELEAAGVAPNRMYFERFISPPDPDRRPKPAAKVAPPPAPASFVLRLAGKAHTVPYEPGLTLLAAAQRSEVKAPSSCEDGYCGTCMAQLVKGDVTMRACKALGPTEIAQGKILMCQALPTSAAPIEVDYDGASFRIPAATRAATPQPLLPRVVAALFVVLIFTTFFLLRSHP